VSGPDFLHAFILGFEVVSRIGAATYPAHYTAGWHSTGSIGVFGAAVGVGRLLGLEAAAMTNAVSLAATQSAGLREMFGSMGKAFHPGRSAQSGYVAALLAQEGFTGGRFPLESPRGFAAVQAGTYDLGKVTEGLGEQFELRFNTYKPFPCGIVVHPTIDAAIQLRDAYGFVADDVAAVELRVAPLVKDLCNKKVISTGLEGKFSIYHAAALGLGRGHANIRDFTDEAANDPAMRRLRDLTEAIGDDKVGEDAVVIKVRLRDGREVGMQLDQSLGNLERPLNDAQLEAKFRAQAGVIAPAQADAAIAACWGIEDLDDVGKLIDPCIPEG
jgi:2-methylcitrate dehydratase PrpD